MSRPASLSNTPPASPPENHTLGKKNLAAEPLRATLMRASAGTGKTYQLTGRLMRVLFAGAAVETVLATTFTRKAAGEILDRVLHVLARAANADDPDSLQQLRAQVGLSSISRDDCLQLLQRLLREIHRLRICTLDSLFSQLAKSFPFELGLPPAWRLTDEIEEVWIREAATDAMISALDPAEMITLLTMLGKGEYRRSIAREVLSVIQQGYSIQRQCSSDVWEQIQVPKAPPANELTRTAGHMRAVEVPQKSLQDKLSKLADCLDARDLKGLAGDTLLGNIARARRAKDVVMFGRSKFPQGTLDEDFDLLYAAVRTEVLSLLNAQNLATGQVLATYDQYVTRLKQGARTLGFDDVAARLAQQFASFDSQVLAGRMDGAIDHLLLDEFQDTSPMQWQVLRPLALRCAQLRDRSGDVSQASRSRSFFCVGDTKQAIYGWRGGVAEIFGAVTDQIPGMEEAELSKSFRSSPVVMDVVNQVFHHLPRHPMTKVKDAKNLADPMVHASAALRDFSAGFPEHAAFKTKLAGYVSLRTSRDGGGDAESQRMACFEDAAELIRDLHAKAPTRSIGVLTRTNRGVAYLYAFLDRMGIDVSQEGGNPLTDSAAVEVILSALMWAEHPGDRRWSFHVRSTPLGDWLPDDGADFIRRLAEDRGLTETIESLAGGLAHVCGPQDTIRLRQLTQLAMLQQRSGALRLRDFVRLVREKRVERPQVAAVRVMTIHQAKGLEFDAVVLPELNGPLTRNQGDYVTDVPQLGDPPIAVSRWLSSEAWHFLSQRWQRAFGDKVRSSYTEAICMLYVAMTRARQALYMLTQPASKSDFPNKTAAALIYHALRCDADPTSPESLLFESGDPGWYSSDFSKEDRAEPMTASSMPMQEVPSSIKLQFQPLPPVPFRNQVRA